METIISLVVIVVLIVSLIKVMSKNAKVNYELEVFLNEKIQQKFNASYQDYELIKHKQSKRSTAKYTLIYDGEKYFIVVYLNGETFSIEKFVKTRKSINAEIQY